MWIRIALALAVAGSLTGCGGNGNGGPPREDDRTPPSVTVTSWTRFLNATGGTATIEAAAADATGISRVDVRIAVPGGQVVTVPMTPKGGGLYTASYTAPANPGTTAMVYKFTVYAYDGAGNQGFDSEKSFEVPSAETPPPPPPFSI